MTQSGSLSKSEFLQVAEEIGSIRLRFATAMQDGTESLLFLDGICGEPIDQPNEQTWTYDSLSLFDRTVSGESFKQFIENEAVSFAERSVSLPDTPDTIHWARVPSQIELGLERLPWPTVEYTFSSGSQFQPSPGLLIGKDVPSFQDYHAAIAAFLGLDLPIGNLFSRSKISLRCQDTSGRITKVVWSTTTVDVTLEGSALVNSEIELASPVPGEVHQLSAATPQMHSFNVPDTGLKPGSWLVLRRDGEWLDYKFLNWPYSREADSGVEKLVEQQDKIHSLIAQGEGPSIEFKENVPDRAGKERDGVCKAIAAFANGAGGTVLLGVRDDGSIKGVPKETTERESIDAITSWIKCIVDPLPDFNVQTAQVSNADEPGKMDSKNIIFISVCRGSSPPYGIKPDKPEYYVRRGATTFPATPEQVRNIVKKSLPAQTDFS
ncbi:MAG: ATP-binding protein [Nitrososphaerota archaeon]|nr:ATP-binding protein [Nitrososphaerota archaeon]